MGAPGYGDYIVLCVSAFAVGVGYGWRRRMLPRSDRVKKAARICATLAAIASTAVAFLGLLSLTRDGGIEWLLRIITGMAYSFVFVMGWIGIPIIISSAIPNQRPTPNSEQDADCKPDHVPS